jgi:hypothetical protein
MPLVLDAFSHPEWAVRNSSLLLFVAMLQRAIPKNSTAMKKYKDSSVPDNVLSPGSNMTFLDFFAQFPELEQLLKTSLTEITLNVADAQSQMHPKLYPILLLFARFSPPLDSPKSSAWVADLIWRCAQSRHYMVRVIAANALVAVVPLVSLPQALCQHLTDIKTLCEQRPIPNNALHGMLLQATHELRQLAPSADARVNETLSTAGSWLLEIMKQLPMQKDGIRRSYRGIAPVCLLLLLQAFTLYRKLMTGQVPAPMDRILHAVQVELISEALDTGDAQQESNSLLETAHVPGRIEWRNCALQTLLDLKLLQKPKFYFQHLPLDLVPNLLQSMCAGDWTEDLHKFPEDYVDALHKRVVESKSLSATLNLFALVPTLVLVNDAPMSLLETIGTDSAPADPALIANFISELIRDPRCTPAQLQELAGRLAIGCGAAQVDVRLATARALGRVLEQMGLWQVLSLDLFQVWITLLHDSDARVARVARAAIGSSCTAVCVATLLSNLSQETFRQLQSVRAVTASHVYIDELFAVLRAHGTELYDWKNTLSAVKDLQMEMFEKEKEQNACENLIVFSTTATQLVHLLHTVEMKNSGALPSNHPARARAAIERLVLALESLSVSGTVHSDEHASANEHWYGGPTYMFDVFHAYYAVLWEALVWLVFRRARQEDFFGIDIAAAVLSFKQSQVQVHPKLQQILDFLEQAQLGSVPPQHLTVLAFSNELTMTADAN